MREIMTRIRQIALLNPRKSLIALSLVLMLLVAMVQPVAADTPVDSGAAGLAYEYLEPDDW